METAAREITWITHPWVSEGAGRVRFGVGASTSAGTPEWSMRKDLAQTLDDLDFDSHWTPDHPGFTADPWTVLASLAGVTRRIRLGPLVNCVAYRNPVQLARQAADVDRFSGGRLLLGLGAGWVEVEFQALSLRYPSTRERLAMLEETVQILHGLWGTSPVQAEPDTSHAGALFGQPGPPPFTFDGTHFPLTDAAIRPPPVQRPRIPIMIAGGGERVTLRQVAQYADMANIEAKHVPTPSDLARKVAVLRDHCAALGRPFESVVVSHFTNPLVLREDSAAATAIWAARPVANLNARLGIKGAQDGASGFAGAPHEAVNHYQSLIDVGVRYFIVQLARFDDLTTLRLLAERVLPALQSRVPAHAIATEAP
jgi:alkanesulfonate monooxygenase SsuD/methylene tetrahydromethanopterin reductase-like flavin-dependent oxidoreductase (luciferase family)